MGKNILVDYSRSSISCAPFSSGHSFEKDFLGNRINEDSFYTGESLGDFSDDKLNLIDEGLCAPRTYAEIKVDSDFVFDEITTGSYLMTVEADESFVCGAVCGEGSCAYQNVSECYCNPSTSSFVCENIPGDDFFDEDDYAQFICNNLGACDLSCQLQKYQNTEKGCYCKVHNNNPSSVLETIFGGNPYPYLFQGNYIEAEYTNDYCCYGDNSIDLSQGYNPDKSTCYRGTLYGGLDNDPEVFNSWRMLSCQGRLFKCCSSGDCNAPEPDVVDFRYFPEKECGLTCSSNGRWY